MGLFSKSKSSTASTVNTTNNINDNRVAASENSIAAGQGAVVNVTSLDQNTVDKAFSFGKDALDFGDNSVNKAAETVKDALDFVGNAQASTNRLIQNTNEAYSKRLADNTGAAPQAAATENLKTIVYGVAVVAGLILAFSYFNKTK